jgi:hypothetical protein
MNEICNHNRQLRDESFLFSCQIGISCRISERYMQMRHKIAKMTLVLNLRGSSKEVFPLAVLSGMTIFRPAGS